MASAGSGLAEKLDSLGYAELLDDLDLQLRATNALQNGATDGLIQSLDRRRGGSWADGVGIYTPGTDTRRDLDIRSTYANQQPMAKKWRGIDEPRRLFAVIESDVRYEGSTGLTPLAGLARMTVALACLAAEHTTTGMEMHVVKDGKVTNLYDQFGADDYLTTMKAFDDLLAKKAEKSEDLPEDLGTALKNLTEEGDLHASSDVCLVVSDFTAGAMRKGDRLTGFTWEAPLKHLASVLEDRLYAVRLTTPTQTVLPYERAYAHGPGVSQMDTIGYLKASEAYRKAGTEKAKRISDCLQLVRHIDLSSTDKTPFVTAADFIFGVQQ